MLDPIILFGLKEEIIFDASILQYCYLTYFIETLAKKLLNALVISFGLEILILLTIMIA